MSDSVLAELLLDDLSIFFLKKIIIKKSVKYKSKNFPKKNYKIIKLKKCNALELSHFQKVYVTEDALRIAAQPI